MARPIREGVSSRLGRGSLMRGKALGLSSSEVRAVAAATTL
jgi:hypothetical protein